MMLQLAKMANMPEAGIRRMILVLDIDDVPRLYVDTMFRGEEEELVEAPLTPQSLGGVDTTTFLNEQFRTAVQLKLPDCSVCKGKNGSHWHWCSKRG